MNIKKKLYSVLGIKENATDEEIKKAFRNQSKKTHPDKGGSAEKFQKVKDAYEVLANPTKRKRYDETGEVDDEIDNREQQILGGIASMFEGIMNENQGNIKYVNIIKQMILKYTQLESTALQQISNINNRIGFYEKQKNRITKTETDNAPNIFEMFLESSISNLNKQKEAMEANIELIHEAVTRVEIYSCEYETEELAPNREFERNRSRFPYSFDV